MTSGRPRGWSVVAAFAAIVAFAACGGDDPGSAEWCTDTVIVREPPEPERYVRVVDGAACQLTRIDSGRVLRIMYRATTPPSGLERRDERDLEVLRAAGPIAFVRSGEGWFHVLASGYTAAEFATLLAELVELEGDEARRFLAATA
jgi:hypothetical protein